MPTIVPSGVEIYYERHGETGEPLVLVHGFTGDITDWRHQIAEFSPSHRVLVLDNRGHGRSASPDDADAYAVVRMAEDVEAVAGHVGFERFHLLGHSMGGAIAQEIALRVPEKLLSLILEDTTDFFADHQPRVPDKPPPLPPERLDEVHARLGRMSPDVLRACWRSLMKWEGTLIRAAGIRVRTLIIAGTEDAPSILEGSKRLAAEIPGAVLRIIEGAAHSPQEERPQEFNALLRAFL